MSSLANDLVQKNRISIWGAQTYNGAPLAITTIHLSVQTVISSFETYKMRLFALPSSVARHLMMGTAFTVVGVTSWFTYQKVFMRNPMRMRKDAEGVWHWMTYEEHLEDRLQVCSTPMHANTEHTTSVVN